MGFQLACVAACSSDGKITAQTPVNDAPDAAADAALEATTTPPVTGPALHHVLSTGQSNSVGYNAKPPISTTQPFANVMFDQGVMTATDCDGNGCKTFQPPTSLVPLVEGDRYDSDPVETMSSGMANEITHLTQQSVLVSVHGRSGNTYECLRKGGCRYLDGQGYLFGFDEAVKQMQAAHSFAIAAGRPYVVDAVTTIHGESDDIDNPFPLPSTDGTTTIQNYADALVEWQKDYENAVKAETGQTAGVPLLVSQMANWNDHADSVIPTYQVEASDRAPGKVVLIGATYMLPFATDCLHYTNEGERRLGEYFAKVYQRVIVDQQPWTPLRATSATLSGKTITVKYAVPTPPIVLDTTAVTDPGNDGFIYTDETTTPPAITGVSVTAPDTITITLAKAPTGTSRHLRYALKATPHTCPGAQTGPRGNVRDSDDLANWSVSFDVAVQ